jgi:hypothetical protein
MKQLSLITIRRYVEAQFVCIQLELAARRFPPPCQAGCFVVRESRMSMRLPISLMDGGRNGPSLEFPS